MTREEFDTFCGGLKGATHVVQWGDASVWKIGGKIFAICPKWGDGDGPMFTFKCSDLAFEVLCDQPGIKPAKYLARAKWVQVETPDAMSDENLKLHFEAAYEIITRKLTKAKRAELDLTI